MKVIILAAGMGSRLGFSDLPKPLTPLDNGCTILGNQLNNLGEFVSLDQVIVVVGYKKEKILEAHPDLLYVYSPRFTDENTSKSLLRALQKVDDDVLWINGDVVFHPIVIQRAIDEKRTCMIVNVGGVGEEEVKYRTDGKGRILEVSKLVSQPEGEALGINFVSRKDVPALCEALANCLDKDYFEKAIENCIRSGMDVRCVEVDAGLCTEVDFPEDLVRANGLVRQWSRN